MISMADNLDYQCFCQWANRRNTYRFRLVLRFLLIVEDISLDLKSFIDLYDCGVSLKVSNVFYFEFLCRYFLCA